MLFETEFNILPVESVSESGGYVYGVLSREFSSRLFSSHIPIERDRKEETDHKPMVQNVKDILFMYYTLHYQFSQDALTEFVNLQEGDAMQATDYLRRYGVYSLYDLFTKGLPENVESFFTESYSRGLLPFAFRLEHLWTTQRILVGMLKLAKAIREDDEANIKAACESVGYSEREVKSLYSGSWSWTAKDTLLSKLLMHLHYGLLIGAKDTGAAFVPTIAAYGILDALFLLVLDNIYQETPLGECENPQCKKLFFVTRKSKKFCSARCQALVKVHRYRKNRELQKNKKRRTVGKPTKRKGSK